MDRNLISRSSSNSCRRLQFGICALALVILLIATTVLASPTGSIAGFVKDPSGAAITGAKLTLTNQSTNAKLEAVSDTNGGFQFLQLAPAVYSLVGESQGFKKAPEPRIVVQLDQITHVDVALETGSLTQVLKLSPTTPPHPAHTRT